MFNTGFRNKARQDLNCFQEILDRYDISFFLLSGVMLGAVREGDFIQHDWDIDLGTLDYPSSKTQIKIVEDMEKEGFDFQVEMSKKSGRMGFHRITETHLHVFELTDEQAVCKIDERPILTFPRKFLKFGKAKLGGRTYKILDKEYLKWMYKDWKTPMKKDYFRDDYNYVQTI